MSAISGSDHGSCSYYPGTWYAVVGARTTLMLPGAEQALVARLWRLVDSDESFDRVLDALVEHGVSALPPFVLLGHEEDATRLLVRGGGVRIDAAAGPADAAADRIEIIGSDRAVWTEHLFHDLGALSVVVAESADDADPIPLPSGQVRLSRLDRPGLRPQSAAPQHPADQPVPDQPVPDESVTVHDLPVAAGPLDDVPADDVPDGVPVPVAVLIVAGEERVPVDRVLLIGRAPRPGPETAVEDPRLLTVSSPRQEISSTHLDVRPGEGVDHGSAVVTDLGSTNGTVLVRPELGAEDLVPGVATQLVPGALINLGDGVVIEVAAP